MLNDHPLYDSDDNVYFEKTGKTIVEWMSILDSWNGLEKGHTKMTIYLEQEFNLTPEWAQAVAIRYQKEKYLSG